MNIQPLSMGQSTKPQRTGSGLENLDRLTPAQLWEKLTKLADNYKT